MTNPLLQLKQVSLTLSTRSKAAAIPILSDISFEVSQCDRISVIGPSGAGKTSLLRLLNRLSESTQGNIYLDNQNIRNIPVLELRRQVMLVPQEPKLLGMTVQEALAYPLVLQQLSKKAIGRRPRYANAQRIQEIRERLRIPAEWLERTELQLSLGQRQLVAIARALVVQPRIVLLDEPTSALDAGIASQVIRVFTDLAQKEQLTILMVNHQLDMAELFCNRLLYLQDTQLLQDSPAEKINWQQLRERLVQAEAKASQEWA